MYKLTCDGLPLLDARDEALILTAPKVKLAENTVGGCSFKIYKNHPYYDRLTMLKSIFEVSDEYGVIFRGRMTENTRDIKRGKAVDLEGAMAFFNDSIVRPYTFPDDWEKENHPEHASYISAAESGNVVEYFLAWLIRQHNEQVEEFQQLKLGTVTVRDPNNHIERASSEYPNTWEELRSKLFESGLGGKLCIRYEADGNYIDYLSEYTETNEQGITYGKNLRDFSQKDDGNETYSAIIPRGAESTSSTETGDSYEGMYGTITGATTTKKRLTIDVDKLPDGNITDDIVKSGDVLYSKKAVVAFGWRFVPAADSVWDDVTEPENLQTKGVEVLEGKATNIPSRIEVKAVDLHCTDKQIRSFRMYKKIPVHILPHGINSDFDINSLDIDLLNPQNTDLAAGKTVMTYTDLQDKYTSELKSILGSLATTKQLAQGFKATETLIEKTEENILLRASELYVTTDELGNYATTEELKSEIAVAVGGIDLSVYAKTTDLDSLSEEVAGIKIAQDGIDLSVYAKTSDLEGLATTKEVETKISAAVDGIDLSVYAKSSELDDYAKTSELDGLATTDELNTLSEEVSQLSIELGKIDLSVYSKKTELADAIDGIEVGGRNLLRDTKELTLDAGAANKYRYNAYVPTVSIIGGQVYHFSADVEILSGTPDKIAIGFFKSDLQGNAVLAHLPIVNGHIAGTITPTTELRDKFLLYAGLNGNTEGNKVKFTNIKLEKGNKATDWTPAPEDQATVEQLSKISMELDKIDLSVYAKKEMIGWRNLLLGTSTPTTIDGTNLAYAASEFTSNVLLQNGQTYTISADVEILEGAPTSITVMFVAADYTSGAKLSLPIENGHISGTTTLTKDCEKVLIYAGVNTSTLGNKIKVSKIFLEEGSTETVWSPAPVEYATKADLALEIKTAEDGSKYSQLSGSADKIIFNSGQIEINTDNFILQSDGTLKSIIRYDNLGGYTATVTLDAKGVRYVWTDPSGADLTDVNSSWYSLIYAAKEHQQLPEF